MTFLFLPVYCLFLSVDFLSENIFHPFFTAISFIVLYTIIVCSFILDYFICWRPYIKNTNTTIDSLVTKINQWMILLLSELGSITLMLFFWWNHYKNGSSAVDVHKATDQGFQGFVDWTMISIATFGFLPVHVYCYGEFQISRGFLLADKSGVKEE